jgi:hypothetical protein
MGLQILPQSITTRFTVAERGHASAILATDFPIEWADLIDCLDQFTLTKSDIMTPGGNKSPIARRINGFFDSRGWEEKEFDVAIRVDGGERKTPTHKVDYFRNRIGIETEWNNKDPFYDRDLNNFRLLHQLEVLSVGVIITRLWELQREFIRLGRGQSFGMNTTHWDKLIPKVNGGGAGGCPLILIGLGMNCYDPRR